MTTVIKVENLSKQYRIGTKEGYKTFRETLVDAAKAPFSGIAKLLNRQSSIVNRQSEDTIWALKDVSFEVKRGEVVGIIGRNGAGKSTLLKILSKITEPTKGRVELRGRVGTLLEVGTGFHPELTGHENVYMYGAILGMDRWEVTRKFDEIVAFAELEKFIETPVKRYSSGMYMRLAFAVASHLESEILLVDEVLAVGDLAFQRKCLGKMNTVAKQGRTILFVSHNIEAIMNLCSSAIILENGEQQDLQPVDSAIKQYSTIIEGKGSWGIEKATMYKLTSHRSIVSAISVRGDSEESNIIRLGSEVDFEIVLEEFDDIKFVECGIAITNHWGQRIVIFQSRYHSNLQIKGAKHQKVRCHIPSLPLIPGVYFVDVVLNDGFKVIERLERAARIEIIASDIFKTGKIPGANQGYFILPCIWNLEDSLNS